MLTTKEFVLRISNIPSFVTSADLREKLASLLCLSEEQEISVRKREKRNFAYCSVFSQSHYDELLYKFQLGKIKINDFLLEATPDVPFDLGIKRKFERTLDRTVADQVTPLHQLCYEDQLLEKKKEILGCVPSPVGSILQSVVASPVVLGYRNKCEFSIGRNQRGEIAVGFTMGLFKDKIVVVEEATNCLHVAKSHLEIASFLTEFLKQQQQEFPVYDRVTGEGFWKLMTVRENERGENLILIQLHPQQLDAVELEHLKDRLIGHFSGPMGSSLKIAGLLWQVSKAKNHGFDEKSPISLLMGEDCIRETISLDGGLSFSFWVSINSFFQVNHSATQVLYSAIRKLAAIEKTEKSLLLDLCCGTGTIGIALSSIFTRVIGIEMVSAAVEDARRNAELNQTKNIEFICSKLENCIDKILFDAISNDERVVIVLDPPRSGVHPSVMRCIEDACKKSSAVQRVIFVSCDCKQANANLVSLSEMSEFFISAAVPFDMFPHTKHCELVVVASRKSA